MSDDDSSLPDLIDDENEELYMEMTTEEEPNQEVDEMNELFIETELVNYVFTNNMRDDEVEEVVREMVDHILALGSDYRSYYFSTDDDLFTYALGLIEDDETIYNDTLLQSLQECECLRKNENVNIEFQTFECKGEMVESCCICMNKIVEKEIITTIKCNHTFHLNCIREWSKYKADCPVCREKI
jgi:hypothetical protein